jgi:hypothetical protein
MKVSFCLSLFLIVLGGGGARTTHADERIQPLFLQRALSVGYFCPGTEIDFVWRLNPAIVESVEVTRDGAAQVLSTRLASELPVPVDANGKGDYAFDFRFKLKQGYERIYGDRFVVSAKDLGVPQPIGKGVEIPFVGQPDCTPDAHGIFMSDRSPEGFVDPRAVIRSMRTTSAEMGDRSLAVEHQGTLIELRPDVPKNVGSLGLKTAGTWTLTSALKSGEVCGDPASIADIRLPMFEVLKVLVTVACPARR